MDGGLLFILVPALFLFGFVAAFMVQRLFENMAVSVVLGTFVSLLYYFVSSTWASGTTPPYNPDFGKDMLALCVFGSAATVPASLAGTWIGRKRRT